MGWKISKWPKSYGSLRLEKRSCLVKDSAYRRIARAGEEHHRTPTSSDAGRSS